MKLRLKNRIGQVKWQSLVTEILLIVIGINVGLWFNNLNDQRKERKLESKILNEFLVSLESDQADILSNIETHKDGIASCSRLIKESNFNDEIQLMADLSFSYSWTFLIADLSSYESLKSIGFQLVVNDEIRRGITKLYNVDYKNVTEIEDNHKRRCYYFEEKIDNLFQGKMDSSKISIASGPTLIRLNYYLENLKTSHQNMESLYVRDVLPNLEDLIAKIRIEVSG